MKYIYIWNNTTMMYSVRFATNEEENNIKTAIEIFNQCKQTYSNIVSDSYKYCKGDVGRFIDDEAYCTVQQLHKDLDKVEELTKGLINLNTDKYRFFLW